MALTPGNPVPFGLYQVMIIPYDTTAEAEDVLIDVEEDFVNLGFARSVAGTITSTEVSNQGNDQVIATEDFDERATATVEQAGINLNGVAALWGTTAVTDGASPDQVTTLTRNVLTRKPYVALRSRSRSSKGGIFETQFTKGRSNGGPNLTQGYGVFGNASIPMTFIPNIDGDLVTYREYETDPAAA